MPIPVECPNCGKVVRAPDSAAGKRGKCPQCATVIDIPFAAPEAPAAPAAPTPKKKPAPVPPPVDDDDVYDAEEASDDGDDEGVFEAAPAKKKSAKNSEEVGDEDRRPCPACGEMIRSTAKKCRYCDEVFDKKLANRKKAAKSDDELSAGDIAFCLIPCVSGLACIFGLVYGIQGKSRGWKMMGLSFAASVVWQILFAIIGQLGKPH